jgi:type II secretory pathway pseudopilin PulG
MVQLPAWLVAGAGVLLVVLAILAVIALFAWYRAATALEANERAQAARIRARVTTGADRLRDVGRAAGEAFGG